MGCINFVASSETPDFQNKLKDIGNIVKGEDFSYSGHVILCKCVQVIDGDTIRIAFRQNYTPFPLQLKVRLSGIDTPEMKPRLNNPHREEIKEKANAAKKFVIEALERSPLGPNVIVVRFFNNDKYGRPLVDIYSSLTINEAQELLEGKELNLKSLNQILIEEGHANGYDGGHKSDFV